MLPTEAIFKVPPNLGSLVGGVVFADVVGEAVVLCEVAVADETSPSSPLLQAIAIAIDANAIAISMRRKEIPGNIFMTPPESSLFGLITLGKPRVLGCTAVYKS